MLPPDVQSFTNFTVAVHAKDAEPAAALVKFLKTEAATDVIKAKGLEPR
jgi:ABC-type molybdate transport system substrate-binding protein